MNGCGKLLSKFPHHAQRSEGGPPAKTQRERWTVPLPSPLNTQRSREMILKEPLKKRQRLTRCFTSLTSATLFAERTRGDVEYPAARASAYKI